MKKTLIMIAAMMAMCLSANVFAQDQQMPPRRGGDEQQQAGWMEKMKAARVAFLTNELDLSSKEAEAFWPVYNQAQAEKEAAYRETRTAYRALNQAIKDGKSDKEVGTLLEAYLKASKVSSQLDDEYLPEYLKVLPATKVAKLYISEEKFRKMQFQNFQGPGKGGPGMRDGQGGPGPREGYRGEGGPGPGRGQYGPRGQRGQKPQTTED